MESPPDTTDLTDKARELERFLPEGRQAEFRALVADLLEIGAQSDRERDEAAAACGSLAADNERLRERNKRLGVGLGQLQEIFRINDQAFLTFRSALTLSRQLRHLADLPGIMVTLKEAMAVPALSCLLCREDFETFVPPGYPCPETTSLSEALSALPPAGGGRRVYVGPVSALPQPRFFFSPRDIADAPGLLAGSCFIAPLWDKYRPDRRIGAFALGDPDPGRYTSQKGTDFLEHFCEVLSGDLLHVKIHEELARQRDSDPLTGIPNRAYLRRNGPALLHLAARKGTPAALLFCDLDRFKAVNDLFGHETGDAVLCDVARAMSGRVRAYDLLARLGGDEFVVLMPDAGPQEAAVMAKRLRACVAQVARDRGLSGSPGLSVSIGVAAYVPGQSIDDLTRQADAAMYADKRASPTP
ncbi:sensor domain-containing diguanylate cyclase [Solidesulfovibrio sp.]|jgi:two-component system cell cycle response regulator|uniref:GGDEF domain-containing protein n=1 Tax=Solidesulfovibrio sp. TaxID=2910990 RepID=UPI002B2096B9|nr:sensor domain-containing diguanylate cyclase [Solidesulfovibrio sp.]MEA5088654.1 sensor domain-containing diguanylate cyclase [Solidesulfovibrio sp.]HML61503.1 sensor domain-containing diguanylate cyclase [Solidesulfovibrio sp.]